MKLTHRFFRSFFFKNCLLFVMAFAAFSAHAKGKPNVVYFLVDNLGMGELSVYSGGALRGTMTPRIDALAKEGIQIKGSVTNDNQL